MGSFRDDSASGDHNSSSDSSSVGSICIPSGSTAVVFMVRGRECTIYWHEKKNQFVARCGCHTTRLNSVCGVVLVLLADAQAHCCCLFPTVAHILKVEHGFFTSVTVQSDSQHVFFYIHFKLILAARGADFRGFDTSAFSLARLG